MQIVHTISHCRAARQNWRQVAFVPTMGALHAGHMSLVKRARELADHVVVSLFVNPTQFAPTEDFLRYPRPIERDLEMCKQAGVDLVFSPPVDQMYRAADASIDIDLPQLTGVLEGAHRPGHFKGVCQVVAKLFNIVQPQFACFGLKDFQQLRVIEAMVEALDWPIQIEPCATLRDEDGLAMSSRNRYLSPVQRQRALCISRALRMVESALATGEHKAAQLVELARNEMLRDPMELAVEIQIDYIALVNAKTLLPVHRLDAPAVLAIAAKVGSTRLIDNCLLEFPAMRI